MLFSELRRSLFVQTPASCTPLTQCGAGIIATEKVIYSQPTALEIQLLPFILPYPLKAWPSRVNISMSQSETTAPSKILPSSREHHPFLSSVDRRAVSHDGGDGSECG